MKSMQDSRYQVAAIVQLCTRRKGSKKILNSVKNTTSTQIPGPTWPV